MPNCLSVSTPIVQRLSMQNSREKLSADDQELYRKMVGSLLYLACWTCPDISFAVSELSRFVSAPGQNHMQAVKHLLRYLKGTGEMGLRYSKPKNSGRMDGLNVLWFFFLLRLGCVPGQQEIYLRICPDAQWSSCVVEV
jgi:hypothetical protein